MAIDDYLMKWQQNSAGVRLPGYADEDITLRKLVVSGWGCWARPPITR